MARPTPDLFDKLVVALDRWQRQRLGIWEFSDDPECILRLGLAAARAEVELADGTVIHPGETVGVIHFWNERFPQIPPTGPDLAWARKLKQALIRSFRLLARHAVETSTLADIHAFGGALPLVYTPASVRLLRRLGLEVFDPALPRGLAERARDLVARVWTWLLRRAFSPASVRGLRLSDLHCRPVWLSRRTLIARYGPDDSATWHYRHAV